MTDQSNATIQGLAKRSAGMIMMWTILISVGPAIFAFYRDGYGAWIPFWVPFCFFTIPAVHYLARELVQARARISTLESRLAEIERSA